MFKTLKTAAFAAVVGFGATAAMPLAANAESLYFDDGADVGVYRDGDYRDRDYRDGDYRDHDRRDYGRRHREDDYRRHDQRRRCTPGRALDKAERLGLRRARVVDVDRRTIEVSGRKFGQRIFVTFSRAGGCPILS